jgi:hypothetical protein
MFKIVSKDTLEMLHWVFDLEWFFGTTYTKENVFRDKKSE